MKQKYWKAKYGKPLWVETVKTERNRFQTFTLDIPEELRWIPFWPAPGR